MKLNDFVTDSVNLEEVDNIIETQPEVNEPETNDVPTIRTGPKIADVYNKIMQREAENELLEAKRVNVVLDPMITNSLTYKSANTTSEFNGSVKGFKNQLDDLAIIVTEMLEIVRQYQHEPENIDSSAVQNFRSKLVVLNTMLNKDYELNTEDTIVGYVEMMTKVLTNVADDISSIRSELATLISKVVSEINGLKVEKYKEIINKTVEDLKKQPAKIVTIADHLIEAIYQMEEVTEEKLIDHIKHHEYIISGATEVQGTMEENISNDTGLRDDDINKIVAAVMAYVNICKNAPVARLALNDGNLGDSVNAFSTKTLPKLNLVYKAILELLDKESFESEIKTDDNLNTVKIAVNKFLCDFASYSDTEDEFTFLHWEKGCYKVDNDIIRKEEYTSTRTPLMSYERLTYISTLMNTVVTPSNVLVSFPETLIQLLKSKAFDVDDTKNLTSVNVALGVILGLTGLYRDEVLYGIYGLQKSLSEIGLAYFNLVTTLGGKK